MMDLIGATEQTVQTTIGPTIRLAEVGEGPTCVFLQGLLGRVEHYSPTFEQLHHRARCIVLDLGLLKLQRDWTNVDVLTETVAEVLRTENLAPCVLVGNSFGGHISLLTAHQYPELVRGLILSGSSGLAERTYEKDIQHRPSRAWLRRKIGELFHDKSFDIEQYIDEAYEELSDRRKALMLVKLARSTKRRHVGHLLAEVSTPTLILWGTEDEVTTPETAREFAQVIPNSRTNWIQDCGHAPMLEAPLAFAEGIEAFLDELDGIDQEDAAA
ncbi:MAG: alpha/beta hydrolase [Phycisphaerales bacterium]|nr:alpha/beta hydrolase [Phycisphaerales bacterium]